MQEYQAALQQRAGAVYFRQIEAHQGHVWNERADALANKGQKSACQVHLVWGTRPCFDAADSSTPQESS